MILRRLEIREPEPVHLTLRNTELQIQSKSATELFICLVSQRPRKAPHIPEEFLVDIFRPKIPGKYSGKQVRTD